MLPWSLLPLSLLSLLALPALVRGYRTLARLIEDDLDLQLDWSPAGPSGLPREERLP